MSEHPLVKALRKPDPVTAEQVIERHHYKAGTSVECVMEQLSQSIETLEKLGYVEAAEVARQDLAVLAIEPLGRSSVAAGLRAA